MVNPTILMRPAVALRRVLPRTASSIQTRTAPLFHHQPGPRRGRGGGWGGGFQTPAAALHTQPARHRGRRSALGPDGKPVPDTPPPTDFEALDVLGATPAPATSVEECMPDGFRLGGGAVVLDGAGALLVGGEAFEWRPWLRAGSEAGAGAVPKLLNEKGQWEVPEGAFGLLGLVWPRPDLLIIGLGPDMRPLSPATRRYISSLGVRVDVLDTRNAASQYNMLATERGVADVAAALIPIGWKEGVGAT